MSDILPDVYLARHAGTAWSLSRQATGRADIPLINRDDRGAQELGSQLQGFRPNAHQTVATRMCADAVKRWIL